MSERSPKVIIAGSGPAGYTAAIYLSRANLPNLLFEGLQPGGQLTITTDVENFPGFPEGIMGPELMEKLRAQAARFGTVIEAGTVDAVDCQGPPFKVTAGGRTYTVPAVIVATGSTARYLHLPGEDAFHGKGLSACATCDGFFYRDQDVVVVGGGDTALEEATYLSGICRKVTLVHRRDELRGSAIMQQRAFAKPNIELAWSRTIEAYLPDAQGMLRGVRLRSTKGEPPIEVACTGCFIAIGHDPNTAFLAGQLQLDANGYLVTKPDRTMTSVEGIFACGDVQDPVWRQGVTAAGTGCMAAIECERWLFAKGL
ncbi:MAG TPA: thioredoxin-disulfide reductase [Candidatus Krumholzibacteria bacterium]|nr:thioredoxin-disulfide reductase [Candidatus Krumholzibacteria bacterium]HPD71278.1 thioredoxin-disulfide reductase [Candidatus Krumholzibacteria bacterium]HRY39022.1 thioredoxin-disulfide reductase [Candidatus Krumholzibacteria bacterium]